MRPTNKSGSPSPPRKVRPITLLRSREELSLPVLEPQTATKASEMDPSMCAARF